MKDNEAELEKLLEELTEQNAELEVFILSFFFLFLLIEDLSY